MTSEPKSFFEAGMHLDNIALVVHTSFSISGLFVVITSGLTNHIRAHKIGAASAPHAIVGIASTTSSKRSALACTVVFIVVVVRCCGSSEKNLNPIALTFQQPGSALESGRSHPWFVR
jgi:hypothetical protein